MTSTIFDKYTAAIGLLNDICNYGVFKNLLEHIISLDKYLEKISLESLKNNEQY